MTLCLAPLLLLILYTQDANAGPTADGAIKKGFIQCGVNTGLAGFGVEADLFTALGYFLFCYPMARYSRTLEGITARSHGLAASKRY